MFQLISLRSSKSSLEEEIQALKVALEEARLEESSAADHCAHLERELALLKRTSDDAAVAHRQAQEELQTITENFRNHMMLSEENRGLLDDLDGKLQTYATRLASAEALVQQLTEQLALCESRSAAFENESKQGASRVRELLSELELLSKRNAELETQCRTEEEEITHLRSVIREEEVCSDVFSFPREDLIFLLFFLPPSLPLSLSILLFFFSYTRCFSFELTCYGISMFNLVFSFFFPGYM